ncbi:MAG: transaldolase [Anaerolineales bacterium]|nr:transaldolase [Anaerolineales bacterium]
MTENPLVLLNRMGQSVWYDNIRRGLLESGEMERMVRAGEIRGVTSNPTIFENAIARSGEYDSAIRGLTGKAYTPEQAYERLALEDIRAAADIFRPVWEESGGVDGYISLEVSPTLANNPSATIREAVRLFQAVGKPNLMMKIPGTSACLDAIRQAIGEGIPVNVTLLFSVERYRMVMEAYLTGLEERLARGLRIDRVASVASFFVSRVDTLVDRLLDQMSSEGSIPEEAHRSLRGKAAIANTRLAYQAFSEFFRGPRWLKVSSYGARIQRPLWASTSTKDPAYPDTYYVEALIANDSVNTMPPATVAAYRDHGNPALRIGDDLEQARALSGMLTKAGIAMEQVTYQLELEGVQAFQKSYESLLAAVKERLPGQD